MNCKGTSDLITCFESDGVRHVLFDDNEMMVGTCPFFWSQLLADTLPAVLMTYLCAVVLSSYFELERILWMRV